MSPYYQLQYMLKARNIELHILKLVFIAVIIIYSIVQIFSNEGEFQSRFGVRGRSPGQLQRPTGVAVHPNGDIIIADYDNKWVSIFSSDGKYKVSDHILHNNTALWKRGSQCWSRRTPF